MPRNKLKVIFPCGVCEKETENTVSIQCEAACKDEQQLRLAAFRESLLVPELHVVMKEQVCQPPILDVIASSYLTRYIARKQESLLSTSGN